MAKIWCETCEGEAKIKNNYWDDYIDCPDCDGKGYTESEMVTVSELLNVWNNSKVEACSGTDVVMAFDSWLNTLTEDKTNV